MLRHPDALAAALRLVGTVLRDFFVLQFAARLGLRRIPVVSVDHPLDATVPFRPESVGVYLDFIAFWIRPLADVRRRFGASAQLRAAIAFMDLVRRCYAEAAGVYRQTLSTTRRPRHLKGRFLTIHAFDPHLMCVPSLHVMIVVATWVFHRRLDADLGARVFPGAAAIAESVLLVKQHSVNCIPAALYALGHLMPGDLSEADVEAFVAALFADDAAVAPSDAAAIREHVWSLWQSLQADGANDATWQPAVLRFLARLA